METHSRSCLQNSMDRGTWQALVHGLTKSRAWLSANADTYIHIYIYISNLIKEHTHTYMCVCACICVRVCVFSAAHSCLTLCDSTDCRLPDFSVHGIFQGRILEWGAIPYSRGSSQPKDWTHVPCISFTGRWILYHCTTWEAAYVSDVTWHLFFSFWLHFS